MEQGTGRGKRRAIAATAALLLFAGSAALLWQLFADHGSVTVASGPSPESRAKSAVEREPRDAAHAEADIDAAAALATREADRVDPVAALDAAVMRELARRGRARFVGLVLDPGGTPCPGAQLFVRGEAAGTSDERGAYEVEVALGGVDGLFQVAARAEGIGSVALVVSGPSRRLDLQLRRGGTVRGRAIDWRGGAPVAGAEVELRAASGLLDSLDAGGGSRDGYRIVARCDAEGRFAFDHVPPLSGFALRAFAPGHDNLMWHEFASPDDDEVREVELVLRRRVAVRGRFAPWPPRGAAAGASVTLRATAERELATTPDADGRFELALTEYAHWALALEGGGARLWSTSFPIPPDSPPIDFGRIDLVPPSTVVGRVALPPELLAFGFVVRGHARDGEERFGFEVPVAADGRFEVGPLVMEECDLLLAWSGEFGGRHSMGSSMGSGRDEFPVERGARLDVGELRPPALLAGRVVDEQGTPISGAEIRCRRGEPKNPFASFGVDARTDGAGRFVLRVGGERGSVTRVRAVAHGQIAESPPFTVGETSLVLGDLVLGGGRRVSGHLVAADGTPVVGARVLLDPAGRIDTTWFGELVAFTGVDGSFEFTGLEPRAYPSRVVTPDGIQFEPPPIAADATEVAWTVPAEPQVPARRDR